METKSSGFSFGFKTKKETTVLKTTSAIADNVEDKEETDFIKSVDGSEIKSVKESAKTTSTPFVIPCIKKNNWQQPPESSSAKKDNSQKIKSDGLVTEHSDGNLDSAAAQALIADAQRRIDEEEQEDGSDPNFSIPLLMQNKV